MTTKPKILAFGGSLRDGSLNHLLAAQAAKFAEEAGAEATVIRLRDYPLPIFDEDVEAKGWPENLEPLKDHFRAADGFIIASPEYNSSVSAALKNAIDWLSRSSVESEPPLVGFRGKTAALLGSSPGGLGGLRGLVHLRSILQNIGVTVVPHQYALGSAHEAFDADGNLKDAKQVEAVRGVVQTLVSTTGKLIS